MSQSRRAAKSIIIMMILGLGSKILGFVREMLIAAKFGSSMQTDAFFIAITATSLFTSVFLESLNTSLIPVMADVQQADGKKGKWRYTNNILNLNILLGALIAILGYLFAPQITKVLASGFTGEQFDLTVRFVRIGMPVIVLACIVGVFRGYLQSEGRFIEASLSQFPLNLVYIFFLIFLSSIFGIQGLMIASVIAVGSQILFQIPGLIKTGYKYRFSLDWRDPYIKKISILLIPVIISVGVNDINKIVDRTLASNLVEGSISALNYSARLNTLALAVFITAIATVLFPMLSAEAVSLNFENFKKIVRNGINIIILISLPITVGMIVLAEPIVKIAFERGAFDSTASLMTAQTLSFYTLGLLGMALRTFMERAYYSLQDTKTPMFNGFMTVGINIGLNLLLIGSMQHRGLALATSASTTFASMYLIYALGKRLGPLGLKGTYICAIKSLIASIIMGVSVLWVYRIVTAIKIESSFFEVLGLFVSVFVAVLVYGALLYVLKVKELVWFLNLFKNKLSRTKP